MKTRCQDISQHYSKIWENQSTRHYWTKGPVDQLDSDFCVLKFKPTTKRDMWTYATCCMSDSNDRDPNELFLFSPQSDDRHIELLTIIAHYHRTGEPLGLGHTVDFGRPWMPRSRCDHGLISLPYLDGPALEWLATAHSGKKTRFLWLIPITKMERDFKRLNGLEALEEKFEAANVNYLDPMRPSIV